WGELCDWYIELAKPRLVIPNADTYTVRTVLCHLLDNVLRLLHPVMPFVTEEIYQKLPNHGESVMIADYPRPDGALKNESAEEEMAMVMEIISSIRSIRQELNIPYSVGLSAIVKCRDVKVEQMVRSHDNTILALSRAIFLVPSTDMQRPPRSATAVHAHSEVYVPLAGLIDFAKERERLEKEHAKVTKEMSAYEKKFEDANFVNNAPPEILEKDRTNYAELQRRDKGIGDSIKWLGA
ncbi:MAG: class I tRNA ligase family protein, partial [Nitrospinae bacterium]|nr:class I tRNA ligase family protein [Nitrospinota bacterium]